MDDGRADDQVGKRSTCEASLTEAQKAEKRARKDADDLEDAAEFGRRQGDLHAGAKDHVNRVHFVV